VTPYQIRLVLTSIDEIRAHRDEVAGRFYQRLLTSHPELQALFAADQTAQSAKFAAELDTIAHAIPDLDAFLGRARELGQRHRAYGVLAQHYELMREPLLQALADFHGADWTPAAANAWRLAYRLIAEAMTLPNQAKNPKKPGPSE
jgi:hemoglobin-like flavoprotein